LKKKIVNVSVFVVDQFLSFRYFQISNNKFIIMMMMVKQKMNSNS